MFNLKHTKICILKILKYTGGFSLAKALNKKQLRILCYHGISTTDQHEFNGLLFMRPETIRGRMDYIKNKKYKILPLSEALNKLYEDNLPSHAVVITIDDGWSYTLPVMGGLSKKFDFPLTVYVTSYYADHEISVLNVIVRYLLWKVEKREIDLKELFPEIDGDLLLHFANKKEILEKVLTHIEGYPALSQRVDAVKNLADYLGFDGSSIMEDKVFKLMSKKDIYEAAKNGLDVQLHTHRHRFPAKAANIIEYEIEKNRVFLEPLVGKRLVHFCYPSGEYSSLAYQSLEKLGIESAVTCEPGFADKNINRFALPRFLDGESISAIEFEAEMCGILELFRKIRMTLKRLV